MAICACNNFLIFNSSSGILFADGLFRPGITCNWWLYWHRHVFRPLRYGGKRIAKTVRGVVKFGKYHDIEVEDEVNVYMEYANGAVGNFIASTGEMPGTNRLEVTAERGKLTYENGNLLFIRNEIETTEFIKTTKKAFGISDNWKCEIPYYGDINQHRNVIENVANAILKDTPLIAPMEEGIRGLELGNSMLLAGLKDKVVTLPMDSDEYAAELEKLIAVSRYQKKVVSAQADAEDMSKSF